MAAWSELEVELIVADYFAMLHDELNGIKYNKSAHRRKLMPLLNGRDNSAIEYKHQNISAIMIKNGLPYIDGYKPMWAFQQLTEEKVLNYLSVDRRIERDFKGLVNQNFIITSKVRFDNWIEKAPPKKIITQESKSIYKAIKRNYLELEQKNRSVGESGEELVFSYEKWRLDKAGYPKLAREVKWLSKDKGDGLGFDILSKTIKGEDMFIEVKSTTLGKETPIYFSKTENDFSNENTKAFYLYRVFELKKQPKMFVRNGRFQDICSMETVTFRGIF